MATILGRELSSDRVVGERRVTWEGGGRGECSGSGGGGGGGGVGSSGGRIEGGNGGELKRGIR